LSRSEAYKRVKEIVDEQALKTAAGAGVAGAGQMREK